MEFRTFADVFLMLFRADQVLLALRENTGYADGQWNLPSGKVEPDEDLAAAMAREAHEEVGLRLAPDQLRLANVVHHRNPGEEARLGFFFTVTGPAGEPRNAEPHKCAAIDWFPLDRLPANTVPYCLAGLDLLRGGRTYGRHGWGQRT